jgi:hypothetical protein
MGPWVHPWGGRSGPAKGSAGQNARWRREGRERKNAHGRYVSADVRAAGVFACGKATFPGRDTPYPPSPTPFLKGCWRPVHCGDTAPRDRCHSEEGAARNRPLARSSWRRSKNRVRRRCGPSRGAPRAGPSRPTPRRAHPPDPSVARRLTRVSDASFRALPQDDSRPRLRRHGDHGPTSRPRLWRHVDYVTTSRPQQRRHGDHGTTSRPGWAARRPRDDVSPAVAATRRPRNDVPSAAAVTRRGPPTVHGWARMGTGACSGVRATVNGRAHP